MIIAGLHCAHILFYNRVLDELTEFDLAAFRPRASASVSHPYVAFLIARQVTLWHYQWLLVNEHLPQIAGAGRRSTTCSGMATASTTRRQGTRSCRSSSARPPTDSGTAWSALPTGPTSPAAPATAPAPPPTRSSRWCSTRTSRTSHDPVSYDRDDLLGRLPRPAPLRRVADILRPRRRERQEQQEGRHHDLERPVHAAGAGDRPAHPDQPDCATPAKPAAPAHLGAALRTGDRRARWAPRRSARATCPTSPACTHRSPPARHCGTTSSPKPRRSTDGLHLGPVGGRIVTETLIGLLRADPTSYLSVYPRFQPFLGTDLQLGPNLNVNITGNRAYTRAHFLYYAGVVAPGIYR